MDGHKQLEGKDCLKCHTVGKGLSDDRCMACHKEIKPFVDSKKGFHGLAMKQMNSQNQPMTCFQCHADHKGRKYDSVFIDEKKFLIYKTT